MERVTLDKELCSITLSNRKLYAMLLNCRGDVLIQELENIINVSIEDFVGVVFIISQYSN